MKVVAICNSRLRDVMPNTQFYNFVLDGESIPISLLDVPDLDYTELLSPNSVILRSAHSHVIIEIGHYCIFSTKVVRH